MKRFLLDLLFPTLKKNRSLIWHHIHNVASCGVAGYNARDKKTPIRRQDDY